MKRFEYRLKADGKVTPWTHDGEFLAEILFCNLTYDVQFLSAKLSVMNKPLNTIVEHSVRDKNSGRFMMLEGRYIETEA